MALHSAQSACYHKYLKELSDAEVPLSPKGFFVSGVMLTSLPTTLRSVASAGDRCGYA